MADKRIGETAVALAFVVVFGAFFLAAGGYSAEARLFPRIVASVGILAAAWIAVASFLGLQAASESDDREGPDRLGYVIAFVGPFVYGALLWLVGYWIASLVALAGLMRILGERRRAVIVAVTAITLFLVWLVFVHVFKMRLPQGLVFEMFGSE